MAVVAEGISAMACSSCVSPSGRPPDASPTGFTNDGRIVLLKTFRKQRNNERHEIDRARRAAAECATENP